MSIVRGEYPERAWAKRALREEYDAAFGGSGRRRLVALANRDAVAPVRFRTRVERDFCRRVREQLSIPALAEGGIRERGEIDRLLGSIEQSEQKAQTPTTQHPPVTWSAWRAPSTPNLG